MDLNFEKSRGYYFKYFVMFFCFLMATTSIFIISYSTETLGSILLSFSSFIFFAIFIELLTDILRIKLKEK